MFGTVSFPPTMVAAFAMHMHQVIEDCDCELRDALDDEAELDFEKFMKLLKSG